MNLLDLPDEILLKVLDYLDSASKIHLWETCQRLRSLLRCRSAVRYLCVPSDMLCTPALSDFAHFITHLTLKNADRIPPLLTIIPRFNNLVYLDVTKTYINMFDAAKLCLACPTIRNFASRFDWPLLTTHLFTYNQHYCQKVVQDCQEAFRHLNVLRLELENIEILQCGHVYDLLELADNIQSLKLEVEPTLFGDPARPEAKSRRTTHHLYHHFNCEKVPPPSLRNISIKVIDGETVYAPYDLSIFSEHLRNQSWQLLAARPYKTYPFVFCATEQLMQKLENVEQYSQSAIMLRLGEKLPNDYNYVHMWRENLLDENAINFLRMHLVKHLPFIVCRSINSFGSAENRIHLSTCALTRIFEADPDDPEKNITKFNLDEVVSENIRSVSVGNFFCVCDIPFTSLRFDATSKMLRNISYLSIINCSLESNFGELFTVCTGLRTLKLICTQSFRLEKTGYLDTLKAMHKSKSLRNLICIDDKIKEEDIMGLCSLCNRLENIGFWSAFNQEAVLALKTVQKFCVGCPQLVSLKLYDFSRLGYKNKEFMHTIQHQYMVINSKHLTIYYDDINISLLEQDSDVNLCRLFNTLYL